MQSLPKYAKNETADGRVAVPRRATGRPQMSDVAALAGVSASTVSRALRVPDAVSNGLRARIDVAIDRLGYVPNVMAGGLAASRTRVIGVIVPSLSNSFFAATIEAMDDEFAPEGYQIMLGNSGYSTEREAALLDSFLSWSPSAIVLTGRHHARTTFKRLASCDVPVVEMWELGDHSLDTAVGFSHRAVGQMAAHHLYARSKTCIAFIGAALAHDHRAKERGAGFLDAVAAKGRHPAISHSVNERASVEVGGPALAALLKAHPKVDAVFFSNDALMLGALFECQRHNIKVPDQLALIGFGDLDFTAWSAPTLSTIRPPRHEIGVEVARYLLRRFADPTTGSATIDLGCKLLQRQST